MQDHPQTAPLLSFPQRPDDRLRLALRRLEDALADQQRALSEWREGLSALSSATTGLGESVTLLQDRLGDTAQAAAEAGDQARRLERTADTMLLRATMS